MDDVGLTMVYTGVFNFFSYFRYDFDAFSCPVFNSSF